MSKSRVQLHHYDPAWPLVYKEEYKRIRQVLMDDKKRIEHIGSTSIPNLAAKPIIDILVGIPQLGKFTECVEPLSSIGYEYVPKPEWKERKFFRKGPKGNGTFHLHICEIHGTEWTEKLAFRDYLRTQPEKAKEYEALKRQLAHSHQEDRSLYTEKKTPFIRSVIEDMYSQKS
ncbi:GrpB family protein [Halobacillus litoralis]|uniref:GrpB family protein n=1 Tax=Halobacillus litoralis TaxID=45668 RepID=A0A410MIT6_9BACI|nr:GrpB family protein [Halobacillus litoralis]QAS54644.1 GrpB family protein [Halobacillus litoralis]